MNEWAWVGQSPWKRRVKRGWSLFTPEEARRLWAKAECNLVIKVHDDGKTVSTWTEASALTTEAEAPVC